MLRHRESSAPGPQVLSDLAAGLNACVASVGWLWQVVIDLPVASSPRFQPPHWSLAFSPAPSAYVAVSQWSGAVHLFHTSAQAAAEAENEPACVIPPPTQGKIKTHAPLVLGTQVAREETFSPDGAQSVGIT